MMMRIRLLSLAIVWILSIAPFVHHVAGSDDESLEAYEKARQEDKEIIYEFRARRTKQIESMLKDAKKRLADHQNGKRELENEERISLERKVELYGRKVDLISEPTHKLEVERILHREKVREERRTNQGKHQPTPQERADARLKDAFDATATNKTMASGGQDENNHTRLSDNETKPDVDESAVDSSADDEEGDGDTSPEDETKETGTSASSKTQMMMMKKKNEDTEMDEKIESESEQEQ